jgi:hypothetical protein
MRNSNIAGWTVRRADVRVSAEATLPCSVSVTENSKVSGGSVKLVENAGVSYAETVKVPR